MASPSMRREWIEMFPAVSGAHSVASPSMRREWIEMLCQTPCPCASCASPSMRREWIEMTRCAPSWAVRWSPSMRREWIEMQYEMSIQSQDLVSLHAEGVD